MEEEQYLVIVDGQDKTIEILSCKSVGRNLQIIYKSNTKKSFNYPSARAIMLESPNIIEIEENQTVYMQNIRTVGVKRVMDFQSHVRFVFEDNSRQVHVAKGLEIKKKEASTNAIEHTVRYWQTIAEELRLPDSRGEEQSFLRKQMRHLNSINQESPLFTYLLKSPVFSGSNEEYESIFPFRFNLSQYEAVKQALNSSISVIEGPPGTGKTQTILNILANLVIKNQSVAVVSSNNAAVQNVKEKLEAAGYGFLVASLGNLENQKKFFGALPSISFDAYQELAENEDINKLNKRLHEISIQIRRLMELENERALLKQKVEGYRLEYKHFQNYFEKQDIEQIGKLSFYQQTSDNVLKFLVESKISSERGKSDSWIRKFKLVLFHGFTNFKKLKQNEMDILLEYQLAFYELKIEELNRKIIEISQRLKTENFKNLTNEHQNISEKIFKIRLLQKYEKHERVEEELKKYKQNLNRFIQTYPIVLSTAQSLLSCTNPNFLFDYVIIDESSQVNLLEGALALSCCKNVIIVGDTRQLPQIVDRKLEQKFAEIGKKVDPAFRYFDHSLLTSVLEIYAESVPRTMLREHYRCHPRIIEFCNAKYYSGELIAFTESKEEDIPLLIYRTAQGNHMREVTRGKGVGKFNRRELDVIEKEVLVDLDQAARKNADLGFVTPYRKQADHANGQFDEEIESDTVHKYQGREKGTMIMSTVIDKTKQGNMGLKFVNDPQMLNVAVSRAQNTFILVTGHEMFLEKRSEVGDLIRYMEYNTMDEHVVESQIVSVFDLLYKDYSERLNSLESRLHGKSRFKSEKIMNTLLSEILAEDEYLILEYTEQVYLKNLFENVQKLKKDEQQYIKNRASVDFVIYHKLDKKPLLAIEVDGFASHDNNPSQLLKDKMKDRIFESYSLMLKRYKTNEICDEASIRALLNRAFETYEMKKGET
ncbi:AAA domain-containing protein [Saccharibacillus sacchari]|uniref:AAA domain-containing protein n=1 Tax=Saccharibacillus sacchari TaxID=456493 RepID=A0ACC6PGH4_9BACL